MVVGYGGLEEAVYEPLPVPIGVATTTAAKAATRRDVECILVGWVFLLVEKKSD